ncbi:MAG: thioredoxin family protein [Verrucomicrobia bacterium]|nr:thioredoxin family protein [Verrucomicrobiota bacterium]
MRNGMLIAVAVVVLSGAGVVAAAEGWLTDFELAKKVALEKKIPILVDFSGSDWCGWCKKLDREVFSQDAFKKYAKDGLVLFLADFPSMKEQSEKEKTQNKGLAEKYGIEGFPTVLIVSADGKELARTGYQPGGADAYVEHIKSLLKAAEEKNTKK